MANELVDLYRQAHGDLLTFRERIQLYDAGDNERLPSAGFHRRWADDLLTGTQSVACEGFRECGKSSIIKAYLLYCITFPARYRSYLGIMRANKTSAIKILREVRDEYLRSPLMREASLSKIVEESADAFCIETRQGIIVRIESYGKGSAVRGASYANRRPDVVILDDIQDKDEMRGDTVPEADWDWFLSDVAFLGKSTRFFMIGNNLGDRCIIERIINSADSDGNGMLGFRCYRVPAIVGTDSSWSARFSYEFLMREREEMTRQGKLDTWLMERMCQSVSDETRVFKREDFRYFDYNRVDETIDGCNLYACLDPASSVASDACYRALVVVAVNAENQWFVIDCVYGRWDSVAMIDHIFATVRRWKLKAVGIEKGHYQQVIEPFIIKEQQRRNAFFDVTPLEHGKRGSKLERISMLAPRFKAHTIFLPNRSEFTHEMEVELLGITRTAIKSQYVDLIDALAMVQQVAEPPIERENTFHGVKNREIYADVGSYSLEM